jgi:hypothetical protein
VDNQSSNKIPKKILSQEWIKLDALVFGMAENK